VALQLELARLREENAAITQQLKGYEADVANLVALGTVGYANPKQKLQYNSQCAPAPLHPAALKPQSLCGTSTRLAFADCLQASHVCMSTLCWCSGFADRDPVRRATTSLVIVAPCAAG
jgi:hypothetical protein